MRIIQTLRARSRLSDKQTEGTSSANVRARQSFSAVRCIVAIRFLLKATTMKIWLVLIMRIEFVIICKWTHRFPLNDCRISNYFCNVVVKWHNCSYTKNEKKLLCHSSIIVQLQIEVVIFPWLYTFVINNFIILTFFSAMLIDDSVVMVMTKILAAIFAAVSVTLNRGF